MHLPKMKVFRSCLIIGIFAALAACGYKRPTYLTECSSPPHLFGTEKDGIGHLSPYLIISIDPKGTINWTGQKVSESKVTALLGQAYKLSPKPQIILDIAPRTPCDQVIRIRTILLESQICQRGFASCSEGHNPKYWHEFGGP